MTLSDDATLSAVKKNGSAFGSLTLRSTVQSEAAYDDISSSWVEAVLVRPLVTFTKNTKNTTIVTMSRRGIELVIANMLLNTETSTMMGTAFTATASGLNSSFTARKREAANAATRPTAVPATRPMSALVPDV